MYEYPYDTPDPDYYNNFYGTSYMNNIGYNSISIDDVSASLHEGRTLNNNNNNSNINADRRVYLSVFVWPSGYGRRIGETGETFEFFKYKRNNC